MMGVHGDTSGGVVYSPGIGQSDLLCTLTTALSTNLISLATKRRLKPSFAVFLK